MPWSAIRPMILPLVTVAMMSGCAMTAPPDSHGERESDVTANGVSEPTVWLRGRGLVEQDADVVRAIVLGELLDAVARRESIAASSEEVTAYRTRVDGALERDLQVRRAEAARLNEALSRPGLPERERSGLQKSLAATEELIEFLSAQSPDRAGTADVAAAREIAASFIQSWKLNRWLFDRYGGRVVYQQGGPEPLDARRQFLEDALRNGEFRIPSPQLANEFWSYFSDQRRHDFLSEGEARKQFATPPWFAPAVEQD